MLKNGLIVPENDPKVNSYETQWVQNKSYDVPLVSPCCSARPRSFYQLDDRTLPTIAYGFRRWQAGDHDLVKRVRPVPSPLLPGRL